MSKTIFDLIEDSRQEGDLKPKAEQFTPTLEDTFEAAKALANKRLGVDASEYQSPAEERRAAMDTVYGDGSGAFVQGENGAISLTKKPSMMTDRERTNLMKAVRAQVHSKYGVKG